MISQIKKSLNQKIGIFALTLLALISLIASFFTISTSARVVRQENEITKGETAVFEYRFNVTTESALGYFELSIESLTGGNISDLIEITSIEETYPINMDTKKAEKGATTNSFDVDQAVYTKDGKYFVRVSPHNDCESREAGGCATKEIPAEIPSRVRVSVKSLVDTESVLFGSGRIFFPNGVDVTPRSWKVNINEASEEGIEIPTVEDGVVVTDETKLENTGTVSETETDDETSQDESDDSEDKDSQEEDNSMVLWAVIGGLILIIVIVVAVIIFKNKGGRSEAEEEDSSK